MFIIQMWDLMMYNFVLDVCQHGWGWTQRCERLATTIEVCETHVVLDVCPHEWDEPTKVWKAHWCIYLNEVHLQKCSSTHINMRGLLI